MPHDDGPRDLVLLDAATLYFRAFHALPSSITAPDGTPVGAVRGFCDMVAVLVERLRPGQLVACWDDDWRPAWRTDLLPGYKAHRVSADGGEEVPEALPRQVEVVVQLLAALGVPRVGAPGCEADDVAGVLATRAAAAGTGVVVVSGDRDLFQLADDAAGVRVVYIGRGVRDAQVVDGAWLAAEYGIDAARAGDAYVELAVLRGDPSDGLPGVAGIGAKTAAALVTAFGSLAGIRAAAARTPVPKAPLTAAVLKRLHAAGDYLDAAPTVVRVVTTIDLPPVAGDLPARPADPDALAALAEAHGIGSSLRRLGAALSWPGDALG